MDFPTTPVEGKQRESERSYDEDRASSSTELLIHDCFLRAVACTSKEVTQPPLQ